MEIRKARTPMDAKKKASLLLAVAALMAVAALVLLWTQAVEVAAGPPRDDGGIVAPLASADIREHYGEDADPEAKDESGNPIFAFGTAADGLVEPTYDPETGVVTVASTYDTPEKRAEAFRAAAGARQAAANTANEMVLAVLDPAADQGLISSLAPPDPDAEDTGIPQDPIGDYLPSAEFREKISGVRYESFVMNMVHYYDEGGELTLIGTLTTSGTLLFDGKPEDFLFYTDYVMDADGDIVSLSSFKMVVGGVVIGSEMVSLP